jgi:peptidylprolyl isomerase
MKDIKYYFAIAISLIALILATYFLTRESNVKKEEIQITNTQENNNYEKENLNNGGGVSSTNIDTNNSEQASTSINAQKEIVKVATTTVIKKDIKNMKTAIIKTNMGEIEVELDITNTPFTAENFKKLAESRFYEGIRFHRVIKDFMIQGGDPFTKDVTKKEMWGRGGPDYQFADEIKSTNSNSIGTISMANSGPNTNGSQFFINTGNNNFLDSKHTVFGKVIKGLDVVLKINEVQTEVSDRPVKDVVIESVTLK